MQIIVKRDAIHQDYNYNILNISISNMKKNTKSSKSRQPISKQGTQRQPSNTMGSILKTLNGFKPRSISNLLQRIPAKQLSSATKKLYGFVKKSVAAVPNMILNDQQQLLPKIQTIPYLQTAGTKFYECHEQISEGFQTFRKSLSSDPDYREQQYLVTVQTSKCFKHLPKQYLQEQLSPQIIGRLLKRKSQYREIIFELMDYHDQVEYNVNLQVSHKIKVFIQFVDCLINIKCLVELSVSKVQLTRLNNNLIKDLIVHHSKKINKLHKRQQSIKKLKKYLQMLKTFKQLEIKIFNSTNIPNKGKILSMHQEYCSIHQSLKKYCCVKLICKYWDINYYVDRCYQDYFIKSLRSYLSEVIVSPKERIKKVFSQKTVQFQSVPLSNSILSFDQSYQLEESVVLVTKINIERDIVDNFKQGMHRCTYATEDLKDDLKILFTDYLLDLYSTINEVLKQKSVSILRCQPLSQIQNSAAGSLSKIPLPQFIEIVRQVSDTLDNMFNRCFSIINRLVQCAIQLQFSDTPERYQVIRTYLIQINRQFVNFINSTMNDLLSYRIVKDSQIEMGRKIIEICKDWQNTLERVPKKYMFLNQSYDMESISRYRSNLVRRNYDSMHNKVMSKDLKKVLQQDTYQSVMVNPRLNDVLGYILDGQQFRKEQKRKQNNLLSSSLLLDRRSFELNQSGFSENRKSITLQPFSLQQDHIILREAPFRIIQSTQFMLDFIYEYMENYDQYQHLRDQIKGKLIELILIYVAQLRQLILNSKALTLPHKKIKAKTINAKHLCLTYVQLSLVKNLCEGWRTRINLDQQSVSLIVLKLNKNMEDIRNKFNKILQLRMMQILQKKKQESYNELIWEVINNTRTTMDLINDLIKDKTQFHHFTGGKQWRKVFINKLQQLPNFQQSLTLFLTQIEPYSIYYDDLIGVSTTYQH